jgi:hypothetical protein
MTPLVPVNVDITTSMVAVVTVLAAIVLGLATIARPSRATIVWGAAFGLGMLGAYLWLAGHQTGLQSLRSAASGLLLCFEPLIWLGLRMYLGRRTPWWPVLAFIAVALSLLIVTSDTAWYLPSFHIVFLGSGAFAGMVAYELLRRQPVSRDIVLPLALASGGFVVVSVVSAVSALTMGTASTAAQLDALRGMNAVGTLVVSTCAAFTLVLLVRAGDRQPAEADGVAQRARRRLRKAEAQNDHGWSVLDVRLDDPADLREATTGAEFARIVDRFHDDVQEALPPLADAERVADDRAIVVIRASDEAVRFHIRAVLSRVSDTARDPAGGGLRASASIGWAAAAVCGYDYDVLVAAAAEAAARAREAGGDQWKRAAAVDATTA